MLLIQQLQFTAFSQRGGSLLFVLLGIFGFIYDLNRCLIRLFIFSTFFWYNIHSLGGILRWFRQFYGLQMRLIQLENYFLLLILYVFDLPGGATQLFISYFFCFSQKRPSSFFFIGPIKKTLFRMMEFTQRFNFVLGSQQSIICSFP